MTKKGQVSIFLILGVVIIGLTVCFFAFRENITPIEKNILSKSNEEALVYSSISDCTEQRAIDAIRIVGLQGGYINLPKEYLETNISKIAYGYYDGKNILTSKETIEKEISYYVELTIPFCINDQFDNLNITKSKASVQTKINSNSVQVSAKMPISAARENKVFMLEKDYKIEIPVNLGNMVDVANEIVNREVKEPQYIQFSYLAGLDYSILAMPQEDNIVYAIVDLSNKSSINGVPYSFVFANKIGIQK